MAGEIVGATPQNAALTAAGVSLKQPERTFLDALCDLCDHLGKPGYPDTLAVTTPEPPQVGVKPLIVNKPTEDDPFGIIAPVSAIESLKPHPGRPAAPVPVKREQKKLRDLFELGQEAGLRTIDVRYIREWVVEKGVHWLACKGARLEDDDPEGLVVFRNPVVRRILTAASALGLCNAPTATKEELADWYTQRIRSPLLKEELRDAAADKLAKLMGYYPDGGKGGGSTNVQINFVNPYAQPPVVDAEVVEEAANA